MTRDSQIRERATAVLGIRDGVLDDEIKCAYRRAALKCHPDTNPGMNTSREMALVTQAYEYLMGDYSDTLLLEDDALVIAVVKTTVKELGKGYDEWLLERSFWDFCTGSCSEPNAAKKRGYHSCI